MRSGIVIITLASFIALAVYSYPARDMQGNSRKAVNAFYDANTKTTAEIMAELYGE